MAQLEKWHNKIITGDQFEIYAKALGNIPGEALVDIVGRHINDTPPTPGRFPTPAQLKQGWWLWQKENQSKVVKFAKAPCNECGGAGFIWCKRPAIVEGKQITRKGGELAFEEVSYRCALCENWRDDSCKAQPAATRAELVKRGYEVMGPHSAAYGQRKNVIRHPSLSVEKLANEVFDRF